MECAVLQLYHLMNFNLQGSLTSMYWMDMLAAAVLVMNCLPHPQSRDPKRRAYSAYELAFGRVPDLINQVATPAELVVIDSIGAKQAQVSRRGSATTSSRRVRVILLARSRL